jgi:hypothetical protein
MVKKNKKQSLARYNRMLRRRAIKTILEYKETIMNPFELEHEEVIESFRLLKKNDMFYIFNELEKVNKVFIGQKGFYSDKKEKKRIWYGYAEKFTEFKLAAYLHKNLIIKKLRRLGYYIGFCGKPWDSFAYNGRNEDDLRFGLRDMFSMDNGSCDILENQHCLNCNFFNVNSLF